MKAATSDPKTAAIPATTSLIAGTLGRGVWRINVGGLLYENGFEEP